MILKYSDANKLALFGALILAAGCQKQPPINSNTVIDPRDYKLEFVTQVGERNMEFEFKNTSSRDAVIRGKIIEGRLFADFDRYYFECTASEDPKEWKEWQGAFAHSMGTDEKHNIRLGETKKFVVLAWSPPLPDGSTCRLLIEDASVGRIVSQGFASGEFQIR